MLVGNWPGVMPEGKPPESLLRVCSRQGVPTKHILMHRPGFGFWDISAAGVTEYTNLEQFLATKSLPVSHTATHTAGKYAGLTMRQALARKPRTIAVTKAVPSLKKTPSTHRLCVCGDFRA